MKESDAAYRLEEAFLGSPVEARDRAVEGVEARFRPRLQSTSEKRKSKNKSHSITRANLMAVSAVYIK